MGVRNSLFVAFVIPTSMLLGMIVLAVLGFTLNMIVLFSLILVLGMLVDNAIVLVKYLSTPRAGQITQRSLHRRDQRSRPCGNRIHRDNSSSVRTVGLLDRHHGSIYGLYAQNNHHRYRKSVVMIGAPVLTAAHENWWWEIPT